MIDEACPTSRKVAYGTRRLARRALRRARLRGTIRALHVYLCQCGLFHLGDKRQSLARSASDSVLMTENTGYVVTQSYGATSIETKPGREGLRVVYRRGRAKRIYVRGYYDTMVGMDGLDLTLREFCEALGITAQDVEKALRS